MLPYLPNVCHLVGRRPDGTNIYLEGPYPNIGQGNMRMESIPPGQLIHWHVASVGIVSGKDQVDALKNANAGRFLRTRKANGFDIVSTLRASMGESAPRYRCLTPALMEGYTDLHNRTFTEEELRLCYDKFKSPSYVIGYDEWKAKHYAVSEAAGEGSTAYTEGMSGRESAWWIHPGKGEVMPVHRHALSVAEKPEKFGLTHQDVARAGGGRGFNYVDNAKDSPRHRLLDAAGKNGWIRVRATPGSDVAAVVQTHGHAHEIGAALHHLEKRGHKIRGAVRVEDTKTGTTTTHASVDALKKATARNDAGGSDAVVRSTLHARLSAKIDAPDHEPAFSAYEGKIHPADALSLKAKEVSAAATDRAGYLAAAAAHAAAAKAHDLAGHIQKKVKHQRYVQDILASANRKWPVTEDTPKRRCPKCKSANILYGPKDQPNITWRGSAECGDCGFQGSAAGGSFDVREDTTQQQGDDPVRGAPTLRATSAAPEDPEAEADVDLNMSQRIALRMQRNAAGKDKVTNLPPTTTPPLANDNDMPNMRPNGEGSSLQLPTDLR